MFSNVGPALFTAGVQALVAGVSLCSIYNEEDGVRLGLDSTLLRLS